MDMIKNKRRQRYDFSEVLLFIRKKKEKIREREKVKCLLKVSQKYDSILLHTPSQEYCEDLHLITIFLVE